MKCAVTPTITSPYTLSSAGRFSSSGRLDSEPLFWLGSFGSSRISTSMMTSATAPVSPKVIRQPSSLPTTLPSGIPSTMASDEPVATSPSAWLALRGGTIRTASDGVIDQKIACAQAMPSRPAISSQKLLATAVTAWLTTNTRNRIISSRLRSAARTASIRGREPTATTHA